MRALWVSCMALRVSAFPNRAGDANLLQCATANCPTMHGSIPTAGNVLTVTGKTDGGTYTPGETLNLASTGGGNSQYSLFAAADGTQLTRSNDAPTTVTAPATGTLVVVCVSGNPPGRQQLTYQKITLTADAGGPGVGIGGSPPPPGVIGGASPPPINGGGLNLNNGGGCGIGVGGGFLLGWSLSTFAVIIIAFLLHRRGGGKGGGASAAGSANWVEVTDGDGRTYYYNRGTGETSWVKPAGVAIGSAA